MTDRKFVEDKEVPSFMKLAYEKQVEYALKYLELFPPAKLTPLTRKQKLKRKINSYKRKLGYKFLAIANGLGAYNDDY